MAKLRPILLAAIFFVVAFDCAFLWQKIGGAHVSEFGGHPDEAGHYVTGLMVRDYIAAGFPGSPMAYAEKYYAHYPKIGLGVWPPLFYTVQAVWTLPFGVGRMAVLLLMATIATSVAMTIFIAARKEGSPWLAAAAALIWLSLPLVREQYGMVMAEGLSALLMFAATLSFGAFLDQGRGRDAVFFGIFSGLAIMTKGTGLALVLMGGLALLLSRRWSRLFQPSLWGGGAIAVLMAGPWTWKFKDLGKGGWLYPGPTWEFTREALPYYINKYALSLGPALLILFVLGAILVIRRPNRRSGVWAAMASLILAVILFQSIAPVGLEARHLIPATVPAMMFVAVGLGGIAEFARRRFCDASNARFQAAPLMSVSLAVVLVLLSCLPVPSKGFTGFAPLADTFVKNVPADHPVLVSSDARGEGMFISEVAMRDPKRPSFTVVRGSKALADSEWSGRGYRPKYRNEDEMISFLKKGRVKYLILDESIPEEKRVDHHDVLGRVTISNRTLFWQMEDGQVHRGGEPQMGGVRLLRVGESDPLEN